MASSPLSIESTIVYLNNNAISLIQRNQYNDSIQTFKDVIQFVKMQWNHEKQDVCHMSFCRMSSTSSSLIVEKDKLHATTNEYNSLIHSKNIIQDAAKRLALSTTRMSDESNNTNVILSCSNINSKLVTTELSPDSFNEISSLVLQLKSKKNNFAVDIMIRLSSDFN